MLVYLVAGEHSGDVLGARLMTALRRQHPDVAFAGIGGPRMAELGLTSLFPMGDIAVMGLAEVLPRLRTLTRRMADAAADVRARRPAVLVTIDSPGFSLRLLRASAAIGVRRVHYVAPQVWAWREYRVRSFPGLWDRLLCLLPFEPGYFARHGLEARFVGHPVLESGADRGDADAFRARHGLRPEQPVLVLMPGSRRSEAPRLLPVFGAMLQHLAAWRPDLAVVVPTADAVADLVARQTRSWPIAPILVRDLDDKHDAYAAAGAALTKSGTSTLELALAGVPMAVTYRVNPLSAALARRLIRVRHVAMVNLLAGRAVVPELLQQDCAPGKLAETVRLLLSDEPTRQAQRDAFAALLQTLRAPGGVSASEAAAREVLDAALSAR